ncbi:MAG TPA: putative Ig domain-containing protein, partial [Candidatus Bathyarchaeia archaeon]|nr:putative Ig domain-containing protein [Candidatus Bathyarchaeia archaeon]
NAQGTRLPALAPDGSAATFVYNSQAQVYQLTLATQNLVPGTYSLFVSSNLFLQQLATFTVTGVPLQILTTSPLPNGTNGVLYPLAFTAIGGTAPYSWLVTNGSLPNGLTLSTAGFLNGTPTATGTFTFSVQVTDAAKNSQSRAYSLTINPSPLVSIAVTPANPSIMQGATQQFTATGTYANNSTQNLTNSVIWMSSATGTASISTSGLATGVNPGGPVTITATLGAISGTTSLTVTGGGEPVIAIKALDSGSLNGNFYEDLQVANTGTGLAKNITISALSAKTAGGTGTVTINTALSPAVPVNLGALNPGANTTVRVFLNVPSTVTLFLLTENGTYADLGGKSIAYSSSQAVLHH